MRIEKIELIGFKSFADKTSFMLHPGITCIVGPNGCGKSNIVDAFRWVLGEQSAKSLRGDRMEEVIFNGSTLKKPKGMAEVTMSITGLNGPGSGNGQSKNDIILTSRRLYRSGESEYMLNKNQCRLRDIRDIFLDTGLEVRSYSILEQGRIGEIINSKPLERRFIIEEVAGVMKYKVRKAEALSKLESSRANLTRINDIIAEIKKQINILDRLAKKAERYKKLSHEMHSIELRIARKEYQLLKDSYKKVLDEHSTLKEKEAGKKAEITSIENRIETKRVELLVKEKNLELKQKNFQVLERDIAEIERSIAVCKNDISNNVEYNKKILLQEEEADVRSKELSIQCESLKINSAKISEEIEAHEAEIREKADIFNAIEEELSDKDEMLEDKRREFFKITEELSRLRNDLSRQQTSLEALSRKHTSTVKESEDSGKVLAEIESSISAIESEIHGRNNEIITLNEKKEVLIQELTDNKTRLGDLNKLLSEAREETASYISRIDSLKEMVFDRSTRELLSANENVRLIASLSDVFDVDAEFESAIESALAEKADSFILESFQDIENAVFALKGKDVDKTAFIAAASPLVSLKDNIPEGVIGKALEFVRVKEEYSKIAENLLGCVLIVRDLKAAFELRAIDGNYTFATLEGEVLEPSGAVIVGGGKGIFQRKREMRELEELIEQKKSDIEKANDEIRTIQSLILEKEEAIKNVESSIYNIEKEISLAKLTNENYMEDKERTNRKLAYLTIELEEISRENESLKSIIVNSEEQMQLVESKKTDIESETLVLQEGIAEKKSELEQYRFDVTEIRLLAASNKEKIEAMRNEVELSTKIIEDIKQKKVQLLAEKESILSRISHRESEIIEHEGQLRELVSEADSVCLDISKEKDNIEKENEELVVVEQGLKALRQQIAEVSSRISDLDVMRAENKLRLENLAENVRKNYGNEIEDVELANVTSEEEDRVVELRNKLEEIGPITPGALEEYEELRTRYEFMKKQQEDLVKSIAELEEAISKINSTTRKKLREAFEALNAKFSEVFVALFGGGKAELVMTDRANILETGIDITAQPPGKKLQNINLLSGGEKALAAIALQFASFLIKPAPLCILDEADAPLDDSNTERFTKMVLELSKETQFIVVTHNKTTMNIAQHLYGITMEEAGVSKVISMQLSGN
jgi:chromosome segregation protein